ncbi:MAG: prepilin-type N-terminal cleavage/methylation domain-containing protein, partial [Desulfobacterales bacterium]|nr:prepilin-type N-terminal cleavage/methylation domain-containing protein [Desulfobacterales bacterium]
MSSNEKKKSHAWSAGQVFARQSGFTLIEMAVVLVLVGIVISIMATVLPTLIQSAKIRKGRAVIEKIDYSLE